MSNRQQYAFEHWLPEFQLNFGKEPWCFEHIFSRQADTIIEIGFGMGDSLATMAEQRPEVNFIGIEVHRPGLGRLSTLLHEKQLKNVRIVCADAVTVLSQAVTDQSLAGVHIFFPDPWPKKRHQKRRLIQTEFVNLLKKKLKKGGIIHCATDWEDYAQHMLEVLSSQADLNNCATPASFLPRPTWRPITKFERRGHLLGHNVWDLLFELA